MRKDVKRSAELVGKAADSLEKGTDKSSTPESVKAEAGELLDSLRAIQERLLKLAKTYGA